MAPFWSFFLPSKRKPKRTAYDAIISPSSDEHLYRIPPLEVERESSRKTPGMGGQRLKRGLYYKDRKMKKEEFLSFARNVSGNAPDPFEDEVIPDKAIVLKMPERSVKTYFIPCPVDLDGMKRRSIDLFQIQDEVDVLNRLEFELFAFGIIPSSSSLPLLRDREVIYVNLLPPRPPTPFSLTLAPPRPENSLVAEVRRPGTGLPFEVVYSQRAPEETPDRHVAAEAEGSGGRRKKSRFKEHMSEVGSRRSRSLSVGGIEEGGVEMGKQRSPKKAWYKHDKSSEESERLVDPGPSHGGMKEV